MIHFTGRAILLDIEGTTSSIQYVYHVLFPYFRKELDDFLQSKWTTPEVMKACEWVAHDAGAPSFADWCGNDPSSSQTKTKLRDEVLQLMDRDIKATGLKELQGLVWEQGFHSGALLSHVFADVPSALERWTQAGIEINVYSSGSVNAQKLFFAHTEPIENNDRRPEKNKTASQQQPCSLLHFFRGYYDTTTGPKKDPDSYRKIASDIGAAPKEVLFLSDVIGELDAAQSADLATGLVVRPGNPPVNSGHAHPIITTFDQVVIEHRT